MPATIAAGYIRLDDWDGGHASLCPSHALVCPYDILGQDRARTGRGGDVRQSPRAEMAETVRLAAPMAATQLGQIAMMTTDLR